MTITRHESATIEGEAYDITRTYEGDDLTVKAVGPATIHHSAELLALMASGIPGAHLYAWLAAGDNALAAYRLPTDDYRICEDCGRWMDAHDPDILEHERPACDECCDGRGCEPCRQRYEDDLADRLRDLHA